MTEETDAPDETVAESPAPSLARRLHGGFLWAGIGSFLASSFTQVFSLSIAAGLLFVASGVTALVSGEAIGTWTGFLLGIANRDLPMEEQLARRRGHARFIGGWFVVCGVALAALGVWVTLQSDGPMASSGVSETGAADAPAGD